MRSVLAIVVCLLTPISGQADALEQKSWKCNVQATLGLDHDFKPVSYRDRQEYRILPKEEVLKIFSESGYIRDVLIEKAAKLDGPISEGSAFIRKASEDPSDWMSWRPCKVFPYDANDGKGEPYLGADRAYAAHHFYLCESINDMGLRDLRFNSLTKRFQVNFNGNWFNHDDTGKNVYFTGEPQTPVGAEFGTCEPYYD